MDCCSLSYVRYSCSQHCVLAGQKNSAACFVGQMTQLTPINTMLVLGEKKDAGCLRFCDACNVYQCLPVFAGFWVDGTDMMNGIGA